MDFYSLILTFAIAGSQLIKLPLGEGGVNLLDMVVIGFCILGLLKIKFQLKKPPSFIKTSFVFIFIALLSLIFTPLKLTSFEFFVSFSYLVRFCLYILIGWLIYCEVFPSLNKKIIPLLLISGTALAIAGLLQLIFMPDLRFLEKFGWDPHYFRTASTFLDPNFLGSYLVLTLIIWYKHFSIEKKWYLYSKKSFAYIGVTIYLALLTTFSRGAYLAFLVSFTTFSILNRSFRQFLLTVILFLGLILGFLNYHTSVAQPRGIDRLESAKSRQDSWEQGWNIFKNSPLLGVGFNAYRFALKEYNLGDQTFLKTHGASTNDSSLLYVLATTGILGFITYLFFLFALIRSGFREKVLPAVILGLVAQSFFANNLFYPPILLWIILMATI